MVGNSTLGNAATGMNRYATAPARNSPTESRMVAIGRSMNGNEKFSAFLPRPAGPVAACLQATLSHLKSGLCEVEPLLLALDIERPDHLAPPGDFGGHVAGESCRVRVERL